MEIQAENGRHRQVTTWRVIRRLACHFRPYRWQVGSSLLMVTVSVGLGIASPLLLQRVLDEALPHRDPALLTVLCGSMIGLGLLSSILIVAESALTNWIGQRVLADLRVTIYARARSQRLEFYSEHAPTHIQSRLVSDVEGVDRLLTGVLQSALTAITALLAAGTAMLILSWPLAMVSFALAALLCLLNNRFAKRRRVLYKERQGHLTSLLRYVAEDLSMAGVLLGRTMRRTERQLERFERVCRSIGKITFRQRVAGASATTVIGASFACVPPVIFWMSGTVIPGLSIGSVVVLVMLQFRLSAPIQSLLGLSGSLQASVAMFERILEYLDLELGDVASGVGKDSDGPIGVRLRGVSYHYAGSYRPVLTDVDLDLPPGSVTIIMGRTGSGKSTLGLILAGLLTPSRGVIHIDGVTDRTGLRDAATMIPQHTMLFDGSIAENLMFARDDLTTAELDAAIATVHLNDLVEALRLGRETPVGVDGHQFSGGERQRLGIARALLSQCRMLVVDEATSALDNETAGRIDAAIRAHCRDKTLVVIAHRLPRLRPGDRVIEMDHGRIVSVTTVRDPEVPLRKRFPLAEHKERTG